MTPGQALAADSSPLSQAPSCRVLLVFPAPTQMPRCCLPFVFSLWVGHDACACVLTSICHEVMGPNAIILVF